MDERKKAIYNKIRNEAKSRGNYVEFVSFSKLEKFLKCKYAYKLQYIDKIKTEYVDNLHADVGSCTHDLIESAHLEGLGRTEILSIFDEKVLSICKKYSIDSSLPLIKSIRHFFEKTKFIEGLQSKKNKVGFEVPVYHKLRYKDNDKTEYWVVGFIDLVIYNDDGTVSIVDFKTSNVSGYTGKKKEQAFLQIFPYAYLFEVMHRGIKVKEVGWFFIKYVNLTFMDGNGKGRKSSKIERNNIDKEFLSKGGVGDITLTEVLDMYEVNKENRLEYMRKYFELFVATKEEDTFSPKDRDMYYCSRFCSFSECCDKKEEIEEIVCDNPMLVMLKSMYNNI